MIPAKARTSTAPRMVSWYGDSDRSGREPNADWPTELLSIKKRVEIETQIKFNAVLLNLYRNGKDGVAWHSDKTPSTNKDMIIASVTFGETRMFRLRHKFIKHIPQIEIPLHHGSFFIDGRTNKQLLGTSVTKNGERRTS